MSIILFGMLLFAVIGVVHVNTSDNTANSTDEPIYYPPQKAAELLSCSLGHLRNLERDKVLVPLRHKRWVRYSAESLRSLRDKLVSAAK